MDVLVVLGIILAVVGVYLGGKVEWSSSCDTTLILILLVWLMET